MAYQEKILERATVKGVADYLLFGIGPNEECRGYEERLEEVQNKFDSVIDGIGMDYKNVVKILDSANEMSAEIALIYTELGMQASLLFTKDMFAHMDVHTDITASIEKGVCDFLLGRIQAAIRLAEKYGEGNREKVVSLLKGSATIAEKMLVRKI